MSQSATGARPITSTNNVNSAQDHLQACLSSMKASIETRLSFNMLGSLMKQIKQDQFSKPTLNKSKYDHFNSSDNMKKYECHSISTRDSDSEPCAMALEGNQGTKNIQLNFNSPNRPSTSSKLHLRSPKPRQSLKGVEVEGPKLKENEMKIMSERIAAGDKKVKTIIHILFRFEEQSIVENIIDRKQLTVFRSISRAFLGQVMSNYEQFRFQHSESISLSILLLSAIKIGMSKKQFLNIVTKISSKKPKKVDVIKKSKCYSMMKKLRVSSSKSSSKRI